MVTRIAPDFSELLTVELIRHGDDALRMLALHIASHLVELPPEKTAGFKAELDEHIAFFRNAGNGEQDWD